MGRVAEIWTDAASGSLVVKEKKGSFSAPTLSGSGRKLAAACRSSILCIRRPNAAARLPSDPNIQKHCEIEFDENECEITQERLKRVRDSRTFKDRRHCSLTASELQRLQKEQHTIRTSLFSSSGSAVKSATSAAGGATSAVVGKVQIGAVGAASLIKGKMQMGGATIKEQMQKALTMVDENEEEVGEENEQEEEDEIAKPEPTAPRPQDEEPAPTGCSDERRGVCNLKAQLMTAKVRARLDRDNDGVLGVQSNRGMQRFNSIRGNKFVQYNMRMTHREPIEEEEEEEKKEMDVEDVSYVRKPNLARIIEEYEAMQNHPKYNLKQVVLSRRFHLYAHRFGNSQYQRTLVYPTLPQPPEMFCSPEACPWLTSQQVCGECKEPERATEKRRTRNGHRFIIAADTQFGILMDGFAMDYPNWSQEIEISRKCVKQINAMTGEQRPKYVVVCGDLVDTESSFSGAIASWKKVMSGWERNLVFEQQVKDFKRVWAQLNPDIALVCLCGNHDVGNKPTRASIKHWTSSFGDDYLSFWCNGTFNLCLNNCIFSNPTGATDLFDEQLKWMEERLVYARANDATHIFVYGHFPWFLKHEEEADDFLTSYSAAPPGWGPPGSSFADSYFTIPYEQRKLAMALFKKYDVTACFSGHFHQNVVTKSSWGMDMIVTGPLSMNLNSEISEELAKGEINGIGMRVIDVGERGQFTHKWTLLDDEEELYEHALERCIRQSAMEENEEPVRQNSLFDRDGSLGTDIALSLNSSEAGRWHADIADLDLS